MPQERQRQMSEEEAQRILDSLPSDVSRHPKKDENSVTTTNNTSKTPPGMTRIYRQASSEEGRKMKKAGGLVPGTPNSNQDKWVSESARYASEHHNTNSAKKQNVYRFEVDSKKYKEYIRNNSLEKSTFDAKSAKYWKNKCENLDEKNSWDQQRKNKNTRNKVGQPPPENEKVNIGIKNGNIKKFNAIVKDGKVKKLSQDAKDKASNWSRS